MLFKFPNRKKCPNKLELCTPGTRFVIGEVQCDLPKSHEGMCKSVDGMTWASIQHMRKIREKNRAGLAEE